MALTKIGNNAVPASAVTQHVTETDLQPVKSDITALALREATNESSAAFNLPNQFIDTFSDDTNLGTQTTVDRVDGYVSSVYTTTVPQYYYQGSSDKWNFTSVGGYGANQAHTICAWVKSADGNDFTNQGTQGEALIAWQTTTGYEKVFGIGGGGNNNGKLCFHTPGESNRDANNTLQSEGGSVSDWVFIFGRTTSDFQTSNVTLGHADRTDTSLTVHAAAGGGTTNSAWTSSGNGRLFWHTSNSYTTAFHQEKTAHIGFWNEALTDAEILALHNSGKVFDWSSNNGNYTSSANLVDYFRFDAADYNSGNGTSLANDGSNSSAATKSSGSGSWGSASDIAGSTTANNATGTLIQSANTVGSAKTKVGGTMLYKDASGTATLGTDLKIYFTCNGGTNWTEASSYSAITPVYSTGIKQVRLGETTCTSGTDIRYKAVWANQASGSKETQLHGIGVNY